MHVVVVQLPITENTTVHLLRYQKNITRWKLSTCQIVTSLRNCKGCCACVLKQETICSTSFLAYEEIDERVGSKEVMRYNANPVTTTTPDILAQLDLHCTAVCTRYTLI